MSTNGSTASRRRRAAHLTKRVGPYLVGRTIGEGTYAKVKYAEHMDTRHPVAIKVLDKEHLVRTCMVDQVRREIEILRRVRHPNVVGLVEVMSSKDKIFVVMELVTGGDLFERVAAGGPLREPAARRALGQLAAALGHCHARGIFHRDLKPENVLLSADGDVKLSDFGLGHVRRGDAAGPDALLHTPCGTPNYCAPEVLAGRGYDGAAADVWSLGVVLFVLLSGCLPFDEEELPELFAKIAGAEYAVPPWVSADAGALLAALLQPDPAKRATLEQLREHPWMQGELPAAAPASEGAPASESAADSLDGSVAGSSPPPTPGSAFFPRLDPGTPGRASRGGTSPPKADLFRESVALEPVSPRTAAAAALASPGGGRRRNAFELVSDFLDISAIFEERDDVVTRHTRFTSRAPPAQLLAGLEHAAVAVGGRVARCGERRLRVQVQVGSRRGTIHVAAEVLDMLPGRCMVDVAKTRGDTVEFHAWYNELLSALGDLVAHDASRAAPPPLPGDDPRATHPRQRINAFELIAAHINLGSLLERDEEAVARHVEFSSRAPPRDILRALADGVAALGGEVERLTAASAVLSTPCGGGSRLRVRVRVLEVLPGVHLVQIAREAGAMLELYKLYNRLAVGRLGAVIMRRADGRAAHPNAAGAFAPLESEHGDGIVDGGGPTAGGATTFSPLAPLELATAAAGPPPALPLRSAAAPNLGAEALGEGG